MTNFNILRPTFSSKNVGLKIVRSKLEPKNDFKFGARFLRKFQNEGQFVGAKIGPETLGEFQFGTCGKKFQF